MQQGVHVSAKSLLMSGVISVCFSWCCLLSFFCQTQHANRDRAATARKALASKGGKPTSTYRGVTHHVRTGRWEAHIWLEGKQVR